MRPKSSVGRYEDYKYGEYPVYIYGDPAGLYNTGDGLIVSYYEKVKTVLQESGFKVKVMMKKPTKEEFERYKMRVKIPVSERIEAVNAMLCSAEDPPRIRIKLNPKCENLIKSLSELQFTEDGKNIDKTVDKKAGRSGNKAKPLLMTHPTDALGYYIYKRFPVLKKRKGMVFFQVPGESIVELIDGKVSSRDISNNRSERLQARREERAKKREQRRLEREQKNAAKANSVRGILEGEQAWDLY